MMRPFDDDCGKNEHVNLIIIIIIIIMTILIEFL